MGFITPGFEEGSLLLKNEHGQFFRLAWEKGDLVSSDNAAQDRRRALPPAVYTLTGYRIVRRDDKGSVWFVSATAQAIRRLTVSAGEEQKVSVDETILMQCKALPGDGNVTIQMMIQGEHHSGLTIYRDGKRIPMQYRMTDAQGKDITSGTMNYG